MYHKIFASHLISSHLWPKDRYSANSFSETDGVKSCSAATT